MTYTNKMFGVSVMARFSVMAVCLTVAWIVPFGSSKSITEAQIRNECSFTRYPTLCIETLMKTASSNLRGPSADMVSTLLEKTIFATVSHFSANLSPSPSTSVATSEDYCDELMDMSLRKLNQSLSALRKSRTRYKEDLQTWLSAVLTYQDNCKDYATLEALYTSLSGQQITAQMDHLSQLASNALALINRIKTNPNNMINAKEHRDGDFPKWVSRKDRKLLLGDHMTANAVVAKDGSGDYKSVGEAIKAAESGGNGRYVIYVKSGVYKEKIRTKRDRITLIGDGIDSTVIEYGSSVRGGSSLIRSATFAVSGDEFMAKDIEFRNTAGVQGEQAIALAVASDHAIIYRCKISGHQDTLYAQSLRQFYRECDISGTIDFIFGNAAAVIQSSNILLQKPKGSNVILASGRTDPGQNTGFSIHRSRIIPGSELASVKHSYKSYLGRPWKPYARSVVMLTYIDDSIQSRGWLEWSGSEYLSSLYYGEYSNNGPGSSLLGRIKWSGYHVMGESEAEKFTVGNFLGGGAWIPQTGVSFISGL